MREATPATERRRDRSPDTLTSLNRLLEAARRRAGFSAVAVADTEGLLVAGAGAATLCEELAAISALAPEVANDLHPQRLRALARRTEVRSVSIAGVTVLISTLGDASPNEHQGIQEGCLRILAGAHGPAQ